MAFDHVSGRTHGFAPTGICHGGTVFGVMPSKGRSWGGHMGPPLQGPIKREGLSPASKSTSENWKYQGF